jgi:hypothetical protein
MITPSAFRAQSASPDGDRRFHFLSVQLNAIPVGFLLFFNSDFTSTRDWPA